MQNQTAPRPHGVPESFYSKLGQYVTAVLSGFDRIRFVDVCINGRQWLARQMDRAGIAYRQRDNCFLWIEHCAAAQKLLDEQLASNWPALMQSFLAMAHPLHGEITAPMPGLSYYWSASQSEYATDVLFDQATQLQKLYPQFLRHAISSFQSPDVMRFLGRKVPQSSSKAHASFEGEVSSRLQERTEGVRIRHTLNGNSLKMYDKEGSILRVETTLIRPRDFRVYRAKEGEPKGPKSWRILRKASAICTGGLKSVALLTSVISRPWLV
jgi:hypothetical protein